MTDIVERLLDPQYKGQEGMRAEAAAEVSRLREALKPFGAALQDAKGGTA